MKSNPTEELEEMIYQWKKWRSERPEPYTGPMGPVVNSKQQAERKFLINANEVIRINVTIAERPPMDRG